MLLIVRREPKVPTQVQPIMGKSEVYEYEEEDFNFSARRRKFYMQMDWHSCAHFWDRLPDFVQLQTVPLPKGSGNFHFATFTIVGESFS